MSREGFIATTERIDRVVLRVILVMGFVGAAVMTVMGVFTAVTRLIDPARYPIDLLAHVPVPITGSGITQAHGDNVIVNASGLSSGIVWMLAASDLVQALSIAVVALSFCTVLWNVVQRRPFHRTMQLAAAAAGTAMALGSLLAQGVGGLARLMASTELSTALGGIVEPAFTFSPLPAVGGFGILALGYVFRAGERMQRDTEGLV